MIEDVAEIAAVDPAIARRAPDEVLGLIRRRVAEMLPDIFAARDHHFGVRFLRHRQSSSAFMPASPEPSVSRAMENCPLGDMRNSPLL